MQRQTERDALGATKELYLFNLSGADNVVCVNTKSHTDDGQANDQLFYVHVEEPSEGGRSGDGLCQEPGKQGDGLR